MARCLPKYLATNFQYLILNFSSMLQNPKLLITFSILIITIGGFLLFFGFNPQDSILAPTPSITQTPILSGPVNFEDGGVVVG